MSKKETDIKAQETRDRQRLTTRQRERKKTNFIT